jgi:hypothetical protein
MTEQQYFEAQRELFKSLALGTAGAAVVPLRTTYTNAARCLTVVHLLDERWASVISRDIIAQLRETAGHHHWYPTHDLHLTLKNIRSAKPNRVFTPDETQRAVKAVERASHAIEPLSFAIHGPICFPTSIILRAFGTLKHRVAVRRLGRELELAGISDDKRYASNEVFIGNITLCRFTTLPTAALRQAVKAREDLAIGRYVADTMQLVECDEVCSSGSRVIHASFKIRAPEGSRKEQGPLEFEIRNKLE